MCIRDRLHIARRGHLGAEDQLRDGIAGLLPVRYPGEALLILRRHLGGKQAERLLDQRLDAAEIVGQRPQRHIRAGGDFTVLSLIHI